METEAKFEIRLAVLESVISGLKENLKLQASEYERRLGELNHYRERANQDKASFVNWDVFNAKQDETIKHRAAADKWRSEAPTMFVRTEGYDATLKEWTLWRSGLENWRSRVIGMAIGIGVGAGLAGGSVAGLLIKLLGS